MSGRINQALEGVLRALRHIGEDTTWFARKSPFVSLAVTAPDIKALQRPALLVRFSETRNMRPETDQTLEMYTAEVGLEVHCVAGSGGLGADAMTELADLMEDVSRAIVRDFRLTDGDPEREGGLQFHALPESMEIDAESSLVLGVAVGVVTIAAKLDFPNREGGS